MSAAKTVRCPICNAGVAWNDSAHWRPFCSQRCKQIDLGAWASDRYTIAGRSEELSSSDPGAEPR